jgi:adhesin/invasin
VAGAFTVTARNADGTTNTGYVGTVHFSSSDLSVTLPANYTFTAADAGVHTFANAVILRKKGKQTLTVTDTQNSALTATDSINVT